VFFLPDVTSGFNIVISGPVRNITEGPRKTNAVNASIKIIKYHKDLHFEKEDYIPGMNISGQISKRWTAPKIGLLANEFHCGRLGREAWGGISSHHLEMAVVRHLPSRVAWIWCY
jgi:hypothetical protein